MSRRSEQEELLDDSSDVESETATLLASQSSGIDFDPEDDDLEISLERLQLLDLPAVRKLATQEGLRSSGSRAQLLSRIRNKWTRSWPTKRLKVTVPQFFGSFGPRDIPASIFASPGKLFLKVFTRNLLDTIVIETNRYAGERRAQLDENRWRKGETFSEAPAWVSGGELTRRELKMFLGILLHMGMKREPELRDHWSTDPLFHDNFISENMSRNRFEEIFRYLHVADNSISDESDKLAKVRPMINALNASFQASYLPTSELAIDEGLAAFSGRCGFVQFMKDKPIKWGIRSWDLVDTNFFLFAFDYYAGKSEDPGEEGLAHRVVMQLVESLPKNRPYRLATDNFYTSIPLAEALLQRNIYFVGTIRPNRKGFPSSVSEAKLKDRGDFAWAMREPQLLAIKWRDTKDVTILSTMHTPSKGIVSRRSSETGIEEQVDAPEAVIDYSRMMQGVDRHDQFTRQYIFDHKSMKWWHSVFIDMLTRSVVNSWVLVQVWQSRNTETPLISQKSFWMETIRHLTKHATRSKRSSKGDSPTPQKRRLITGHWPLKMRASDSKPCACGCKKRTIYRCSDCDVALIPEHFGAFHM